MIVPISAWFGRKGEGEVPPLNIPRGVYRAMPTPIPDLTPRYFVATFSQNRVGPHAIAFGDTLNKPNATSRSAKRPTLLALYPQIFLRR